MLYSIVDDNRREPFPRGKGICPYCGNPTISKCGQKVTWHWAHRPNSNCDPWWENETEWHRQWKSKFPNYWQEIVHTDDQSGEKHIADVKTPSNLVIEFQNSQMSLGEAQSREVFYKNMIWVVNGLKFLKNFHILARLPDPSADWVTDFVFLPMKHTYRNALTTLRCWRKSENPNYRAGSLVLVYMKDISKKVDRDYVGHHLFEWVKPRTIWLESKKPVYFNFGDEYLWQIKRYGNQELSCVHAIKKEDFINNILGA